MSIELVHQVTEVLAITPSIRPTTNIFEWINGKSLSATETAKNVGGFLIAAFGVFIFVKSKGRIAAILAGFVVVALGGFLIFGDAAIFGQKTLKDTVNSAPAIESPGQLSSPDLTVIEV